jgi:Zn-finger nucleic acid-binding protein|tara:strand:+ start:33196 stop:33726 length:531 start_codon:yes stop_codon:yes gene_type:complete
MICPVCKINLDRTVFYGVEVDYCPKCLGFWFEENELRLAKDYKDRSLRWLDIDLWKNEEKFKISSGQKLCPSCRLPLYEVNYGNSKIKVDLCNICNGIWLDRGEFKRIIKYLKQKADWEIFNNHLKNLREEFWEIFSGPESLKDEVLDFLAILKVLNYKFVVQHPNIAKLIAGLPK